MATFPARPTWRSRCFRPTIGRVKCSPRCRIGSPPDAQSVWVVDPKTQTVTVYGADRKAIMLTSADVLTGGELLPGFNSPVAGIFTM